MTLQDAFAENLSKHGDIARAALALGRSASWGRAQFDAIRKRLGDQAR